MEESHLPRKASITWYPKACPVGRPLTIICHTYLHTLWMIREIPEDVKVRKLNDWMPNVWKDSSAWKCRRLELNPYIIGHFPPT
eukprot:289452-Ditylum_brightwellii.AAC.1